MEISNKEIFNIVGEIILEAIEYDLNKTLQDKNFALSGKIVVMEYLKECEGEIIKELEKIKEVKTFTQKAGIALMLISAFINEKNRLDIEHNKKIPTYH